MYAKISPEIGLRRWVRAPHGYYRKGHSFAQELTPQEYELLERCDGIQELDDSDDVLQSLLKRELCLACEQGDKPSGWSRARLVPNRYFPSVGWGITFRCNYNCKHCFSAKDTHRPTDEFSWEECLDFIEQADECGINAITLTGGESLLHPNFLDIVGEITRRGMFVRELNTNGAFVTADLLESLKALGSFPEFKISFDGLGYHDWLRNAEGAEDSTLRAIKLCLEHGFRVRVQCCIHRGNKDGLLA